LIKNWPIFYLKEFIHQFSISLDKLDFMSSDCLRILAGSMF